MHLQTIRINNVLALGGSITFYLLGANAHIFCGPNESGKSTVIESVRSALTGELLRVGSKKELALLLHDIAREGGVTVTSEDGESAWFELPSGQGAHMAGINATLRTVLKNGSRFTALPPDEARALLLATTGTRMDAAAMIERLVAKGFEQPKIDALANRIGSSIEAARKEAEGKAREAKGAWRVITGETYGSVKAKDWAAPIAAAADGPSLDEARVQLAGAQAAIAALREEVGSIKTRINHRDTARLELDKLEGEASVLKRREKAIEAAVTALDEQAATTERLRGEIVAGDAVRTLTCPHCGGVVVAVDGALTEYTGPTDEVRERSREAVGKLGPAEKALALCQNAVKNAQRDLDKSKAAAAQAERLRGDVHTTGDLEKALRDLEDGLGERVDLERTLVAQIKAVEAAQAAAEKAGERTAQAAEYHADVVQWESIAEALSPSGIQAELMADALAPVLERLARSAQITGWGAIEIDSDMRATRDGMPYVLLSESARWRVDAMIAEALSFVSGLGVLLLDGADKLELQGRSQLVKWLSTLGGTTLVGMTLKEPPGRLPAGVVAHWMGGYHEQAVKVAA